MRRLATVILVFTLLTGSAPAARDCQTPIFADWSLLMLDYVDGLPCEEQEPFAYTPCADFTYVPHPGGAHGYEPEHIYTRCLYDRVTAAAAPRGIMIRNRNCPFPFNFEPYTPSPGAIDTVLAYVPDMEFVFMDLEGSTLRDVEPNIVEVAARARAVNPDIRAGNYNYFPGEYDGSVPYESQADRTSDSYFADLNEIYLTSGLDVAMPSCYPYEYHEQHTLPGQYGGSSPNERSALFWAPLERLSVAKRDLPAGHMLMPWIAPLIACDGYDAPAPPPADVEALTQHFRLRGADAFYSYSPGADGHPDFDAESYRQFVLAAWLALDVYFEGTNEIEVLNLSTNKVAGVEWSGIRNGDRFVILASNLGTEDPTVIALPEIVGLPETISVPLNEHLLFDFDPTGCADVPQESGPRFELDQNRPNPFNPMTTVRFNLYRDGFAALRVFDVGGRLVRTLVAGDLPAGAHEATWRGDDVRGRPVASGVYLCRLESAGETRSRMMVLVR
ncbi:MAG: hypothetical protein JXB46_07290 [Candidatus Eisenbacteria bacterium]|nr:hypothetical protein [Candidatus Eisenbacteria bacterium]